MSSASKLMQRLRAIWMALLLGLLLAGCGGDEADPENQIREMLDQIEAAAENRQLGELMSFVSEDYQDDNGRTPKELRAIVQLQFIRNPKIHTFKLVRDLKLLADDRASLKVLVALAGRPIDSASALSGLRADLMRFDLELVDQEGWKIRAAEWQWAEAADFL